MGKKLTPGCIALQQLEWKKLVEARSKEDQEWGEALQKLVPPILLPLFKRKGICGSLTYGYFYDILTLKDLYEFASLEEFEAAIASLKQAWAGIVEVYIDIEKIRDTAKVALRFDPSPPPA